MLGHVQQIGRHQASVGDHDGDICPESAHPVAHVVGLLALEGGRSAYVKLCIASHRRHRRGVQRPAASFSGVCTGKDPDDVVLTGDEGLQGG